MMKKEHKKENLPVSTLKSFQAVEKAQINVLEELSKKIDRSIDVNIELQAKIANMMAQISELANSFKEIARFLRGTRPEETPSLEEQKEVMSPSIEPIGLLRPTAPKIDVASQLRELVNQNRELTETLRSLETELKKTSTKEAIKKALEKSHMK